MNVTKNDEQLHTHAILGTLARSPNVRPVVVHLASTIPAIIPEEDPHPIPHRFIGHLDELELDHLPDLQPRRSLEPEASAAQVRADPRVIGRRSINCDNANRQIRKHSVQPPAVRCDGKLNPGEGGFDRIGHN